MSHHNKGLWWCRVMSFPAPNTVSKYTLHHPAPFLKYKALLLMMLKLTDHHLSSNSIIITFIYLQRHVGVLQSDNNAHLI